MLPFAVQGSCGLGKHVLTDMKILVSLPFEKFIINNCLLSNKQRKTYGLFTTIQMLLHYKVLDSKQLE